MTTERRTISTHEIRMVGGNGNRISGYAARYSQRTKLPGFSEVIAPGAFDRVLRGNPDVACLLNHDPSLILGRTASGTLQLSADANGLRYECELPNTSTARDLKENIRLGNISGSSFAFTLGDGDDSWSEDEDRATLRTIRNFSLLLDVSAVTYPAYGGTSVGVDRGLVVSAEARSRAERVTRVHAIGAKWKAKLAEAGVIAGVRSLEDVIEDHYVAVRNQRLDAVLED